MKGKYILNPKYNIKSDEKRVLIVNVEDETMSPQFTHPIFASLLSFFNGKKGYEDILKDICSFFKTDSKKMNELIKGFIENPKEIIVEYDNDLFRFPSMMLIPNVKETVREDIDPHNILLPPPYDFSNLRLYRPMDILFVINTKCVTDCIYCYADKLTKYEPMPTERILQLIDEAHDCGVRKFELTGGEVFMHRDWKTIVSKLVACGYCDFISTKVPITKAQIDDLVKTGVKTLQISLDSLNSELQSFNLKVDKDYCARMMESVKYLDTKNIEIIIKSTLTRHTCTVENIMQIIDFISDLKHLKKYTVSTIGASLYKSNESFHDLKPTFEETQSVYGYLDTIKDKIRIQPDNQETLRSEMCNFEKFKCRSLCTGNVTGLVVLPDGKVTICEELYWKDQFIIGDLMKDDLMSVWQSDKALSLWNIQQNQFPQESGCAKCQDFSNCRKGLGVCWKYVISVYGDNNYLYPDPRCPKAPQMIKDVFYD